METICIELFVYQLYKKKGMYVLIKTALLLYY